MVGVHCFFNGQILTPTQTSDTEGSWTWVLQMWQGFMSQCTYLGFFFFFMGGFVVWWMLGCLGGVLYWCDMWGKRGV
jgi:hypothetical protein